MSDNPRSTLPICPNRLGPRMERIGPITGRFKARLTGRTGLAADVGGATQPIERTGRRLDLHEGAA